MKKTAVFCLTLALALLLFGCGREAVQHITFPFEAGDVERIEMFYYTVPASAEKKVVTDASDIEALYHTFENLSLSSKKAEERAGAEVYSFRFHLSDGISHELIYISYGVKNGILKSPTAGFEYFTSADLGWQWSFLNEALEATPAEESELPEYPDFSSHEQSVKPSRLPVAKAGNL